MNGHMQAWIDGYLDGELSEGKRQQVEKHLANCSQCRELLGQRQQLSNLLQAAPAASGLKTPEQFAAEIGLRLPRRRAPVLEATSLPASHKALHLAWQMIPVFLLLALAFLQTVSTLGNVLSLTPGVQTVLEQSVQPTSGLAGLLRNALTTIWPEGIERLSPLNPVGFLDILEWNWLTSLGVLVCIGLSYIGWLASWFARNQEAQPGTEARLDIQ
jgi:predicted anti-sigma-YlaC factor YlaD